MSNLALIVEVDRVEIAIYIHIDLALVPKLTKSASNAFMCFNDFFCILNFSHNSKLQMAFLWSQNSIWPNLNDLQL